MILYEEKSISNNENYEMYGVGFKSRYIEKIDK